MKNLWSTRKILPSVKVCYAVARDTSLHFFAFGSISYKISHIL